MIPVLTVTGGSGDPDLDGPELLSVDVSPTTVAVDGGKISLTVSAKDASGVIYAAVCWKSPSNNAAGAKHGGFAGGKPTGGRRAKTHGICPRIWGLQ